jgi:hypothetical protein
MRKPEFFRDRLNHPAQKVLVPHWTRFHLRAGVLDAIRKHPVVVLRLAQPLQRQQTLHVRFRQPNGAIGTLILRRVELAAVDRAHHPQHPFFGVQIGPLERQLLRSDTGHGDQPDGGARRLRQVLDQQIQLAVVWQLRLLPYLFRREVCTPHWIGLYVSVLDRGGKDRTQSPFQVLERIPGFSRRLLQVEEPLYRLGIDLREEPVAKMRKIVQPDIVFVSVLRRPLLGGHLQFAVLLDETAKRFQKFSMPLMWFF